MTPKEIKLLEEQNELIRKLVRGVEDIKAGRVTRLEDFEKEMEKEE